MDSYNFQINTLKQGVLFYETSGEILQVSVERVNSSDKKTIKKYNNRCPNRRIYVS